MATRLLAVKIFEPHAFGGRSGGSVFLVKRFLGAFGLVVCLAVFLDQKRRARSRPFEHVPKRLRLRVRGQVSTMSENQDPRHILLSPCPYKRPTKKVGQLPPLDSFKQTSRKCHSHRLQRLHNQHS